MLKKCSVSVVCRMLSRQQDTRNFFFSLISVAIVAMVNSTALAPNGTVVNNDTCPLTPSPFTDNTDGPFNWNEQQQVRAVKIF